MSTSPQNGTIVITGCSSGFGRITALHLANLGWQVFATVRKEADQASLLSEATTRGCSDKLTALLCDITRAEQVAALGQAVSTVTPRLDALLNNAGTGYAAPLELLPLDDLDLGWQVFATVRKEADQASLLSEATTRGCSDKLTALLCDITRAEQVAALGQAVSTVTPRLDALLNNAGTGYAAPLELLPLDDLRAQLEINVIAHLAVTQVLLPLLKPARGV